jgi:transcriptional regulator with XRE-family HTH domain
MAKGKYHEWLTEEGLNRLQGWKRNGLTDEQIAEKMGIGSTTLYRWMNDYREIREALKTGKEDADMLVENALFQSAMGYDYEEITEELKWDNKTRSYVMKVTKRQKKHQAPSNTAQIFWLKNRRAEQWRDKVENNITLNEDSDALSKAFEELMGNNDEGIQQETTSDSGISEN